MQDILYNNQFGFRPMPSTVLSSAITNFVATVENAIELKIITLLVLLDLSKVFDTMDQKI